MTVQTLSLVPPMIGRLTRRGNRAHETDRQTSPAQGTPSSRQASMSVVRPPPIPYQPIAPSTSILLGLHYRITILTDGLIRYEWSEDGKFEDRPSTFAINRNLPTPKFELIEKENLIKVITDRFELEYDRKPFSPNGFTVVLRENGECRGRPRLMGVAARFYNKMWRYGLPVQSNLGGTARTLDFYDGPVPLQPGVLSRVHRFFGLD